ncbi:MAG: SH3 domain-containing protein, partial [Desulfovibrionaceae bacterium]|nr:SH3 domain-containing protein [Desulfovibrionaceae bacterium]
VPMGYQVVEPIRSHAANRPDRVEVIIDLLNVRYGPEASEEVIAQVGRYSALRVLGSAPGWLYVEVEGDDLRGWVMDRYVSANISQG